MTYARAALWFWVLATVAWTLLLAPSAAAAYGIWNELRAKK
ncbi:hypothetical protein PAPYRUS_99 [Mycobacterium phage Papyrus]|uniref:Uncharacterized protein n=1 Tax=Mycobacterium phage Papyrus TaxID=1383056 RepID=S5Y1R2_9CAUD|nr:hypothetical protein N842_gp099 [Mycobacterium phage Papyrus]AGT14109.1 hypothetical protein PAPYRUS_99 [Mycobacterium phage Papyrus]